MEKSMSDYSPAESVESIAQSLLANQHPELVTARVCYLFIDSPLKKGGQEILGKASKVSGKWSHLTELDFVVEISLPMWNDMGDDQRHAGVDHLLECCKGEEGEDGSMKWSIRTPDVHEFSSILQRHGIWHKGLTEFVQVAQSVDLASIVEEETGETVETEEDLNLNALDD